MTIHPYHGRMANGGHTLMLAAIAGAALVGGWSARPGPAPTPPVATAAPVQTPEPAGTPTIGNGGGSTTLARAADGHFYADARVNGVAVRFLVDTGASSVVLTPDDARRAGLGSGEFSAVGVGAGGTVALRPVTLARLAIGPLAADAVPAMVAEGRLPVSLLGQAYLARIGTIEISGDRMMLR